MGLLTRDLVCRDAVELVTDYLEGRLTRRNRRRFEAHIAACRNCRTYLEQIRRTIAATGSIEPEDLTPGARDELTRLFRRYRD
ncbi:MAG: zf-HC2 domain-containing protein, partial [Acidimicrobiaceae bacterium]|nr:zf-HC2 domain-containing protein [Acidimicrobiaceae bacterium]